MFRGYDAYSPVSSEYSATSVSTTFVLIEMKVIIVGVGLATYLFLRTQPLAECIRYALSRAIDSFPYITRKLAGRINERLYGWDLKECVESMMNMDWMHEEGYEQQRSDSGTIKIRISPESMAIINGELLRLKEFNEVRLDADIRDYLEDAHSSFKSKSTLNPRESKFKKSLVHYAAMGDCSELLRFLLANGVARDDRDQNSRTPLSWAAEYVALDSVRILLDDGAEINSMDDMLLTPLSWLVHAGVTTLKLAATEAYMRERGAMLNPEEDQNCFE